ncbi:TetR/AcrR family transcriptional regulator [Marinomonas ostreistagni]|uniref:TetR/AcrR family transcriptional regulator n=1 Tax=Marinomonas ostreistagni TaxID=359209 RepID=UPI00194F5016|nr:TetR/AcrR family transcriptional regulator [Marinomonas ostreistagni]MBM6551881.1 TetR/AcrR family transcriptional regulator [Marinomonas ostreistagni]
MARGRPSKKGLIAEAAQKLFRVSGYQGTSIDQVVIEAGVSKPTVYSNYPSKLLLWQEVLQRLIAQSQTELEQQTQRLIEQKVPFNEGWLQLWRCWCDCPNRLSAYRIHWGEAHKLSATEKALFSQLEQVLAEHLQTWLKHCQVDVQHYLVLFAVAQQTCLIAQLTPDSACDVDLMPLLDQLSQ